MRLLSGLLVGLVFLSCGERPMPVQPAGKVSADCSLAEIFSGKEGCAEDPSLDEVPEGYVPPVDTTATAVEDTLATAPADTLATAPADTLATAPSDTLATAPADSPEAETPSDTAPDPDPDPVVPEPVVIHVPGEEEPEVARSEEETLTAEQARAELDSLGIAYTAQAFIDSAGSGNLEVVKLFVLAGMDLESADDYDWTALHWAAAEGHLSVVQYLVGAGANIRARDEDGWTVLMNAAGLANNLAVVRFLVESGADVLAVGDDQRTTAWSVAMTVGNTAIADYLKSLNNAGDSVPLSPEEVAEVAWDWDRLPPSEARAALDRLHVYYLPSHFLAYAGMGDLAVVKLFVWAGMSVDTARGYDTVLTAAVKAAGQRDASGASSEGHLDVVKFLVAAGADLEATRYEGYTALHWAAQKGELEMVKVLVGAGSSLTARNNWKRTALHLAAGGSLAVVKFLVGAGADVNAGGWTPLHVAASEARLDIMKFLVGAGADVDAGDRTPLHAAAAGSQTVRSEDIRLLVMRYLVLWGADVNATDNSGWTALHHAVAGFGRLSVVRYLVEEHGLDVDAANNKGKTPRDWAADRGRTAIVEYFDSLDDDDE